MRKKIFQSILALCLVGIIILAGNYFLNQEHSALPVQAGTSDNVSGFAWSEKIGWIDFNSADCDSDNNGFLDVACGGDNSTISIKNYGTDIDSNTGDITGFAWSENIGWIDLAPAGPYPALPNYPTKVATTTLGTADSPVTGWARAVAHGDGWDGWIKLSGTTTNGKEYKTYIDSSGNWHGWAWGSDVIGWISFNRIDCDSDNNGFLDVTCEGDNSTTPIKDYKVAYQIPHTLTISCPATTLDIGETTQCSAIYDSTTDVTASSTWALSDNSIATINNTGLVTAISSGSTNVSATYNGIIAPPITITVNQRKTHWYEIIPW